MKPTTRNWLFLMISIVAFAIFPGFVTGFIVGVCITGLLKSIYLDADEEWEREKAVEEMLSKDDDEEQND